MQVNMYVIFPLLNHSSSWPVLDLQLMFILYVSGLGFHDDECLLCLPREHTHNKRRVLL